MLNVGGSHYGAICFTWYNGKENKTAPTHITKKCFE